MGFPVPSKRLKKKKSLSWWLPSSAHNFSWFTLSLNCVFPSSWQTHISVSLSSLWYRPWCNSGLQTTTCGHSFRAISVQTSRAALEPPLCVPQQLCCPAEVVLSLSELLDVKDAPSAECSLQTAAQSPPVPSGLERPPAVLPLSQCCLSSCSHILFFYNLLYRHKTFIIFS